MNITFIILISWFIYNQDIKTAYQYESADTTYSVDTLDHHIREIWLGSQLKDTLSFELFNMAMRGYYHYGAFDNEILSIIDFSRSSEKARLYIIDLKTYNLLFHTLVSHGKNTGEKKAIHFSNKPQSLKSSLGFFKTAEIYHGKHGYSLRIDGLEKGINDNARKRAVVIHGAEYVSQSFIKKHGRLGRSFGCPALPIAKTKDIIDAIANGSCLFIYSNNESYLTKSKFIK